MPKANGEVAALPAAVSSPVKFIRWPSLPSFYMYSIVCRDVVDTFSMHLKRYLSRYCCNSFECEKVYLGDGNLQGRIDRNPYSVSSRWTPVQAL